MKNEISYEAVPIVEEQKPKEDYTKEILIGIGLLALVILLIWATSRTKGGNSIMNIDEVLPMLEG